jgi:hypothetical protein
MKLEFVARLFALVVFWIGLMFAQSQPWIGIMQPTSPM